VLGYTAALNLEPYSTMFYVVRAILLGLVSLFFLRLIMSTVRGAFTDASV